MDVVNCQHFLECHSSVQETHQFLEIFSRIQDVHQRLKVSGLLWLQHIRVVGMGRGDIGGGRVGLKVVEGGRREGDVSSHFRFL